VDVLNYTPPRVSPGAVELHPFRVQQAEGLPFLSPACKAGMVLVPQSEIRTRKSAIRSRFPQKTLPFWQSDHYLLALLF
jgi:hypothetical protein